MMNQPKNIALVCCSVALILMPGLLGCAMRARPESPSVSPSPLTTEGRPESNPPSSSEISPTVTAPNEPIPPPDIEEPEGLLTLRQALALALAHHPDLAVRAWDARIEEARMVQAGARPNPEIGLEVENVLGTGDHRGGRAAETTLQLSQLIELGDKRAKRSQAAAISRDLAEWDYEVKRLEILTQTGEAFVEVLIRQENVGLKEENVRMTQALVNAIDQRVQAALASAVERTRAEVALATAEVELDQARRLLSASRQQLASMWNNPEPRFQRVEGTLETNPHLPSLDTLRTQLRENPRLTRWATEIARRQADLRLEESRRIPNLTVLGGYRRLSEPDDHAFVAGISVPLPLFQNNQGAIQEAAYQLAQAEEKRRAQEWFLFTSLDQAWHRLSTTAAKVKAIKDKVLPATQETYDQVNVQYAEGRFGYLEVLDTQRTLLSVRAQYLEALGDYHRALMNIERLVGNPLNEASPHQEPSPH